jgi:hypothetical protein
MYVYQDPRRYDGKRWRHHLIEDPFKGPFRITVDNADEWALYMGKNMKATAAYNDKMAKQESGYRER